MKTLVIKHEDEDIDKRDDLIWDLLMLLTDFNEFDIDFSIVEQSELFTMISEYVSLELEILHHGQKGEE